MFFQAIESNESNINNCERKLGTMFSHLWFRDVLVLSPAGAVRMQSLHAFNWTLQHQPLQFMCIKLDTAALLQVISAPYYVQSVTCYVRLVAWIPCKRRRCDVIWGLRCHCFLSTIFVALQITFSHVTAVGAQFAVINCQPNGFFFRCALVVTFNWSFWFILNLGEYKRMGNGSEG